MIKRVSKIEEERREIYEKMMNEPDKELKEIYGRAYGDNLKATYGKSQSVEWAKVGAILLGTAISASAAIAQVYMVLHYEDGHIITSKALQCTKKTDVLKM